MDWTEFVDQHIPSPDTIVVEALVSSGAYGPTVDTARGVPLCVVQDGVRQTRAQNAGASGKTKASTCLVWAPPDADIPAGSWVTLPSGSRRAVLTSEVVTASGHDLPEHLELALE